MEVTDASNEQRLLAQALLPQDESTSFFALLGVLVGVLLAGSATMLTMADRRDELKALSLQGFSIKQLIVIVISQGVILGATASLAGVAVGYVLAISLFAGSPDYLASAFPLGAQTTVSATLALGVWAGGVAITCVCVAPALRRTRRLVETPHRGLRMLACGVVLAVVAMLVGSSPLVSAALLTTGLLLAVPAWLGGVVHAAAAWPRWSARLRRLVIAAGSVRALETRAIVLSCTAAVGVFGAVVAQSTHHDLLAGLERGYARYVASASIWVTSPGDDLATSSFPPGSLRERIAPIAGVRVVRPYYGGWLDVDGRRVWLIARDPGVPAGELLEGRQPRPGTAALSVQLAHSLDVRPGSTVELPTPQGTRRLTVAGTTTNLGWSSGVVFLSPADYTRWWGTAPAALEVNAPRSTLATIQRTAGPGLQVQTAEQRATSADALPRQGLKRLSQIAWLLVAAAAIAVALAISAAIWQRRGELASLRLQSFTPRQVQAVLAWESTIIVGSGIALGLLAGAYGHVAADAYLRVATGYPVIWSLQPVPLAAVAALVAAVTALVLAAPGFLAARAPLRLALE
jgi:putative ABC transport system permease protein